MFQPHSLPIMFHLLRGQPEKSLTHDDFFDLCQRYRDWRIERTKEGEVIFMAPAGGGSGHSNAKLTARVDTWAEKNGSGVVFDSSTGFILPNGATRSPDVAWLRRDRLAQLTPEQKRKFLPLCPDFLIELRSPTDALNDLQDKMQEYADNGAQLGWLIDPDYRRVYVYRPNQPVEVLENIDQISDEPVLPGFMLDLTVIWQLDF